MSNRTHQAGKRFAQHTWVVELERDEYNMGAQGAFPLHIGVYHPAWVSATQEVERARRFLPPLCDAPASTSA